MLDQTPSDRPWLAPLVSVCQRVAGNPAAYHSLAPLNDVVATVPESVPPAERLMVRSVLSRLLRRLLVAHDPVRCAGFRARLTAWAAGDPLSEHWRDETSRVIASWDHAPCDGVLDVRVQLAMDAIHARCKEPGLTLQAIAFEANLCMWYAAKLLKRQTGRGFLAHLHECRIAEARRLLETTTLSAKEVAAAVGYGSASDFGRWFRRVCGETPTAYRRRRLIDG